MPEPRVSQSRIRAIVDPVPVSNQVLMFILGVGSVWVFLGTIAFYALGYPQTPLGWATAIVHLFIPTIVAVGGHELAHYIVASEYCNYDDVSFVSTRETLGLTVVSVLLAFGVVLLDAYNVVSLPSWVLVLGVVSPGAVYAKGFTKKRWCIDETALVGPLYNFVVGFGLWWMVTGGTTNLTIVISNWESATITYTMLLSIYLGFFNALPFGPLDGAKVRNRKEPVTVSLLLVVIAGSGWLLWQFSPF